jgi:predicted Zn finger-like uncharacterized protein
MNVRCPQCQSTFRVDPDRIPPNGIKARCSRCSTVFELTRTGARAPAAAGAPSVAPTPAPPRVEPAPPPEPPRRPTLVESKPATPAAGMASTAAATVAPAAAPTIRPLPERTPTPQSETAASAPAPTPKRGSFRNQDPSARAERLARALVSDIVAYNKEKLKQTRGAAALRTEFREEIRKSWEEYVEQVGLDLAKNTPYFRDSLNELLAKGEKVF